ncbi:hypothetical protein ARMSODRAFT_955871 [Armillaria solidipes]|uniref:Uncharacterized protein n=1 Tax=Armillaria solidipes TaxID=1076256 RepID=A0A2H3BHM1_9AGAR|nr:hypothetical protein ARMSODRAFT_955871 [Armillaria solidipes]
MHSTEHQVDTTRLQPTSLLIVQMLTSKFRRKSPLTFYLPFTSLTLIGYLLWGYRRRLFSIKHSPNSKGEHHKCCFCKTVVESPEHAMLGCTASQALVHVRREMLVRVMRDELDLVPVHGQLENVEFLKKKVQSRKATASVAKWAHVVLKIFYAVPVYRGG